MGFNPISSSSLTSAVRAHFLHPVILAQYCNKHTHTRTRPLPLSSVFQSKQKRLPSHSHVETNVRRRMRFSTDNRQNHVWVKKKRYKSHSSAKKKKIVQRKNTVVRMSSKTRLGFSFFFFLLETGLKQTRGEALATLAR